MKIENISITEIKLNPDNPRTITDEKFQALIKSIKDFPEMLQIRPIVVDSENMVLGGNMRLKACKEAGLTEVPIIRADSLTDAQKRHFIISDNVSYGEFDWPVIAAEWSEFPIQEWGLDIQLWEYNPANKEKEVSDLHTENECPKCGYKF